MIGRCSSGASACAPPRRARLEAAAERRAERSAQLFGFVRTINERLPRERRVE